MRLDIYVNYPGTCEQAFRFYEQHLGGRVTGIVRHREQPNPNVPADWKDKVVHARIEIGTTVLMGADIPQAEPMRSAYLTLTLDREEEAERLYGLLANGGQIFMKMAKTPFANRFAMLRDRFGTSWMLLHQPASPLRPSVAASPAPDARSAARHRARWTTVDPSSFVLGALLASAKILGIGAVGFAIAWWRARKRIRQLEAERQLDPQPLLDRMDRLEGTLDSVAAALERLAAGQSELQRRLPPPRASASG